METVCGSAEDTASVSNPTIGLLSDRPTCGSGGAPFSNSPSHDVLVDAIVVDVPDDIAIERNAARPDRDFGPHVIRRQHKDLRRSLPKLGREGLRRVHVLTGVDDIAAATSSTADPTLPGCCAW